jgi:hypothetical protein
VISFGSILLKVISDHVAILQQELNALQLANVGYWIACNGNEVSKLPGLNGADAVQPSISAALMVMARITSSGSMPASRKLTNVATLASPRVFAG